jgi:hypothetical protein
VEDKEENKAAKVTTRTILSTVSGEAFHKEQGTGLYYA